MTDKDHSPDKTGDRENILREELERVGNKLDLILDFSSDGYWEISCNERMFHIDSRLYSLIGYTSDKLVLTLSEWENKIHPSFLQEAQGLIEDLLCGRTKDFDFEYQFQKPDGDYLWLRSIGRTVDYEVDKMPEKIIGITRNMNKQKNQEERNKLQNELQSLLLIPGSLEIKLQAFAKTVADSIEISCLEIWLKEEGEEKKMQFLYGSNSHLNRDFKDDNPLNRLLKKALVDPYNVTIYKLGIKVIEYFNTFTHLMVGSLNFYSLKLADSDGDILGILNVFTEKKIPMGILNFLLQIQKLAAQVIINDLSEKKFREALQLTEKANRLMEGREVRIREIKKEINDLTTGLGWGEVYKANLIDHEEDKSCTSDLNELRKNALSMAEDAEIARREAVEINNQLTIIQHAVNSSGDAIAISTVKGDLFYTNTAFNKLFGYILEPLSVLTHELLYFDKTLFFKIMEYHNMGKSWDGETEMVSHSGERIPVSLRSSPIRNEIDQVLGLIWIYSDITRQKRDEKIIKKDLEEKQALLQKAMILQQSFIQKSLPVLAEYNVQALFLPCEKLGGDFFRIIDNKEKGKLVIIVGDCTDHGIKASMDASLITSMLEPLLPALYEDNRTDEFLKSVSLAYSKVGDEDQFPTMFVLIVDYKTGRMFYSSANSTIPFVIRDKKILQLEKAEGMHIAYFASPNYERKRFDFKSDDKILLFSDAVLEIKVHDRVHSGYGLMSKILEKNMINRNNFFHTVIDDLKRENSGFPLTDDTTFILLEHLSDKQINYTFHDLKEWKQLLREIVGELAKYDYTDREIDPLSVALDELCINAFTHGNKRDKQLNISMTGKIACDQSEFTISDEGEGFDISSISLAPSYGDSLLFHNQGNSVSIVFGKKSREVIFKA